MKEFGDGFMKGCLQGKTPSIRNQSNYCTCLNKSYQSRYDGRTLNTISQLAGRLGNQGPTLVNIMMSPEAKSCAAKN